MRDCKDDRWFEHPRDMTWMNINCDVTENSNIEFTNKSRKEGR
jgi:hypothetical protein